MVSMLRTDLGCILTWDSVEYNDSFGLAGTLNEFASPTANGNTANGRVWDSFEDNDSVDATGALTDNVLSTVPCNDGSN